MAFLLRPVAPVEPATVTRTITTAPAPVAQESGLSAAPAVPRARIIRRPSQVTTRPRPRKRDFRIIGRTTPPAPDEVFEGVGVDVTGMIPVYRQMRGTAGFEAANARVELIGYRHPTTGQVYYL